MYKCEYCGKKFKTRQGLAGHKSHCPLNPNKKRTHESNSEANKKARLTYIARHPEKYVKKVFKFICPKCGNEYEVLKTECEIKKGNYKKYCSLTCANSHVISQETRNKISQSLKTSDKAKKAALNSYTTYYCKNCGKPFTLKDERDTTGRKYCSLHCKEEWLRTNLYSKCGGHRKGSGIGKKGYIRGRINKLKKQEYLNYKVDTKVRDENGRTESQKQAHIKARKVKRPSLDILQKLSKTLSNTQIGNMYGVTESSIRRWKKYYNIV